MEIEYGDLAGILTSLKKKTGRSIKATRLFSRLMWLRGNLLFNAPRLEAPLWWGGQNSFEGVLRRS